MAPFSGLKIGRIIPLVVGLFLAYHVVMQVEGGSAATSVRLTEEEELELERQLNILNKPPVKTLHTRRGVIYDCIEFHKQPAFDHPLLKNHTILKKDATTPATVHTTLTSEIEGCPKGTVPIRRTTKEDLIRAKYLSAPSNAPGDHEYRAGISLQIQGERFFGTHGIANVWQPTVNPDQFTAAETAIRAGHIEEANEIRFGWMVYPGLYGDNLTSMYGYWTGDGSHQTGCYNTLCPGFVQVDPKYPIDLYFENISVAGGAQFGLHLEISMERETGDWWLTLEEKIKIGYWPSNLFKLLGLGADYIYWGGRVKSGKDGITPVMASGNLPDRWPDTTGYYAELQYKKNDDTMRIPGNEVQFIVDCKGSYNALWDNEHTILHFGGPGGGTCA
ncbi:hypothetical protein MKW94_001576 [Papaver nudicaule]|uniref:Neprosin PEP catalytic domain-containing protein n=1 Tax=Papaver nudicaule TaxID=74823 RepID=A0AA41VNT0_PAPNU|nr:hypothetical protein [Papaver nudicaule]